MKACIHVLVWISPNIAIFILPARSNNVEKKVKKRGGGFNKLCSLSTQLQKLVGVPELARTEVKSTACMSIFREFPSNLLFTLCGED